MGKKSKINFNILMFWFGDNWGEGRTFQKVAEHLAEMPEIGQVALIFPPSKNRNERYSKPLEINRVSENLTLLRGNDPVIPLSKAPFRLRSLINNVIRTNALRIYLEYLGFNESNTVLWLFPPHPYLESIAQQIPHTLLVAHIVDNFEKSDDTWLQGQAAIQYPNLQENADVIITGSDFNHRIFSVGHKNCYLFENAVDDIFIGKPSASPGLNGSSSRLGYVGTISKRTDTDLLKYVAVNRSDWTLLIAGRQELSLNETGLLDLPNISYLGVIPYQELPEFIQNLDVCLIPHINTDYCKSMSPLKLYQYLASGRPVVSTNIEGLGRVKEYLLIADTYEEFVHCIEQALKNDTVELSRQRIEAARRETWDRRVQDMFAEVKTCHISKAASKKDSKPHPDDRKISCRTDKIREHDSQGFVAQARIHE